MLRPANAGAISRLFLNVFMLLTIPTIGLVLSYQYMSRSIDQQAGVKTQEGLWDEIKSNFKDTWNFSSPKAPKKEVLTGFIQEDQILTEEQFRPTATPPPLGYGDVVIQTDPIDAKIFLNDRLISEISPLTLKKQSNQKVYKLTILKDGYEPFTKLFNVEANRSMTIVARLKKQP